MSAERPGPEPAPVGFGFRHREYELSVVAGGDPEQKQAKWSAAPETSPLAFEVLVKDWEGFAGRRRSRALGEAVLIRLHADPCVVRISPTDNRAASLLVHIGLVGEVEIVQEGLSTKVGAGDIFVVDSSRQHRCIQSAPAEFFLLPLPRHSVDPSLLTTAHDAPLVIPSDSAVGALLGAYTRMAWTKSSRVATDAGQAVLEMIIASIREGLACRDPWANQASSHMRATLRRARIVTVANYHDPNFTPGRLASLMKISPRHLTSLFTPLGVTPGEFILRLRLHAAWDLLSDPKNLRTIEQIAQNSGFSTPSHFTRTVRAEFQMSPREIRQAYKPTKASTRNGLPSVT